MNPHCSKRTMIKLGKRFPTVLIYKRFANRREEWRNLMRYQRMVNGRARILRWTGTLTLRLRVDNGRVWVDFR